MELDQTYSRHGLGAISPMAFYISTLFYCLVDLYADFMDCHGIP